MNTRLRVSALGLLLFSSQAFCALRVITTTSDLNAIVTEVGGKDVESEAICKGAQDPHYIEPKPSFMVKTARADLVVAVGMGLEVGWLPNIVRGSRNPAINPGGKGYLEVGSAVQPLEVPTGNISRADGDVHPEGNPHVTLDPIRTGEIAVLIAKKLGELDAPHAAQYNERAAALQKRLIDKTKVWAERIVKSKVTKVVTFHKTLTYFLDRFKIENPMILEPLPGLPPTAKHVMEVIARVKSDKISLILVENFFDPTVANRIEKDAPGTRVAVVPVAVGGDEKIKTIDDIYENLVSVIEGKG
ncbi:MAG: zinc ABC transporter substrate-binding protein [Proteobacteria bacterium]|nr:MAG: zinc ABC transporter substrate-binding protein [Pseudomonadota bacterium]